MGQATKEKNITITTERHEELLKIEEKWDALVAHGVEDWEEFDEAMEPFGGDDD